MNTKNIIVSLLALFTIISAFTPLNTLLKITAIALSLYILISNIIEIFKLRSNNYDR